MITIDAHSRDMVRQSADTGSTDVRCFTWACQLLHVLGPRRRRLPHCASTTRHYGYEYLGNGCLVITPLTDRIYMSRPRGRAGCLSTALQSASTSKTETTKDLSAQLSKLIYIRCARQDGLLRDGRQRQRPCRLGPGAAFDEFNRLVPEVPVCVLCTRYKCVTDSQKRKSLLPFATWSTKTLTAKWFLRSRYAPPFC
jgi:hypothetical protein